jgi:hypothetical protein
MTDSLVNNLLKSPTTSPKPTQKAPTLVYAFEGHNLLLRWLVTSYREAATQQWRIGIIITLSGPFFSRREKTFFGS